jgi:hypothetical protein
VTTTCTLADHMAALLSLVERCPSAAERKGLIIAAHWHGAIDQGETALLIQALMLETA